MFAYAAENLNKGDLYLESIQTKNILLFCKIPLALAKRTLKALNSGKEKMDRAEVESTVEEIISSNA